MNVQQEFSRHADGYVRHNKIQMQVAKKLCSLLSSPLPKRVLDLGCGSGAIYDCIDWPIEKFIGVDFSLDMLKRHPTGRNVELICGDFNDIDFLERLADRSIEAIFSSSALQWAKDLDIIFQKLSKYNTPIYLGIFTSNTFRTLHETAGINSLIPSKEEILTAAKRYFSVQDETVEYTLKFESVREMFQYIKKTGVSGGRKALSFKQMKELMHQYPLDYLEFEVLFVTSFSKA